MVRGLDQFKEYFAGYDKSYILIGGTACEIQIEGKGIPFRATKDIDMLLVIEVLNQDFLKQFWRFIKEGGYRQNHIEEKERKFFRFENPENDAFPVIVELFSKKPGSIELPEGFHLTPIPTDEEISSMSAMLMDDDYYNFTISNCSNYEGLMVANEIALICLKAKAYLNNVARRNAGQEVRSNDIDKHKKDVLKLTLTLSPDLAVELPESMKSDLKSYVAKMSEENVEVQHLAKDFGLAEIHLEEILAQIRKTFKL